MKRLFTWLLLTAPILGFVACDDSEENPVEPTPEPVEIVVTPEGTLLFEPEGGTRTLSVQADGAAWGVEKSDAWINIDPDTEAGTIEVTVGPWDNVQPRSGKITVTGGAEPVSIDIVQNGVEPQLSIDTTQLTFGSERSEQTIAVTAVHVDWQVTTPDAEWIVATADTAAGTLLVTVEENTEATPRNGSFRITGEGVDDIVVTVMQEAAASVPFWERSIAYRMGYRGKVRTVSSHLDFVNGPSTDLVRLDDLQFDANGNLTSFVRDYGAMTVTVDYDAANRITAIHAKSEANQQDFTLLFEYGSHGKYAPIFEIFEYDLEPTYCPIDFRSWLPLLIKDLAAVKIRDAVMPENNLALRYSASGNEGAIEIDYEIEGYDLDPYYSITFSGDYPTALLYEGVESAIYEIDAQSGQIGSYYFSSYYDILVERAYDRLNTTTHSLLGTLDRRFAYNDNCDVISRTVDSQPEYDLTASYTYDAQGNWVSMSHTIGTDSGTAERIVTYWE